MVLWCFEVLVLWCFWCCFGVLVGGGMGTMFECGGGVEGRYNVVFSKVGGLQRSGYDRSSTLTIFIDTSSLQNGGTVGGSL